MSESLPKSEFPKPPEVEYLWPHDNQYPIREATLDDFPKLWEMYEIVAADIQLKEGSNGMWEYPYPSPEEKAVSIKRDISSGNTFIVEDDFGEIAGTITVTEEFNPLIWSVRERSEPSLHITRMMRRPDVSKEDELGKEMLWWAEKRAYDSGKVYIRLEVWDQNEKLKNWYRDDCLFQQLPSTIFARYPASARFQMNVGDHFNEAYSGRKRIARIEEVLESYHPYGVVDDLDPYVLAAWRSDANDDSNTKLLTSMLSGRLSSTTKEELHYHTDWHHVTSHEAGEISLEGIRGAIERTELHIATLRSKLIGKPVVMTETHRSYYFDNLTDAPMNIFDMLSEYQQIQLMNTLGLSKMLIGLTVSESHDFEPLRGKQYLFGRDGKMYDWNVYIEALERPIDMDKTFDEVWRLYKSSGYAGDGVLIEGDFDGHDLYLGGKRFKLGSINDLFNPEDIDDEMIIVESYKCAPDPGQFGFQPYTPKPGDRLMARLHKKPGSIQTFAEVVIVQR